MKRLLCIILTLTMALSAASCSVIKQFFTETNSSGELYVHFLDVGQGDSILLESEDEFVLIDAGERDYGEVVRDYIIERGADELKYVIATHPHSDHVGGLRTVLNGVDAENFITTETDCETYTWTKLLTTVEKQKINYIDAEAGDTYTFGSASFTILAPLSTYSDYNNSSVVVKVNCGKISFLLAGDAEKSSEYDMVKDGENLKADVLKCAHHGSSSSTTAKFLKAVNPSYAIISCGKNNDYGHPHKETLQKLDKLGCTLYRTDEMGTIVAYTDGSTLSFETSVSMPSSYTSDNAVATKDETDVYIGNKNSKVFHTPDCSGVSSMNEKNKVTFSSREEAVEAGYTPCSSCKP